MSTPKFHRVTVDSVTPQTFMVWAPSEPAALKLFRESFISVRPATQLEIVAHGKADLPVLGLPESEATTLVDTWMEAIAAYVEGMDFVTVSDVLSNAIELPPEQQTLNDQRQCRLILSHLRYHRTTMDGKKIYARGLTERSHSEEAQSP